MREIALNKIEIDGEEYPIYCDLYVLEQIQERMSINQFERDIIGAVVKKEKNGSVCRDENGRIMLEYGEFKAGTMIFGLALMINEGIDIENDQTGKEREMVSEKEIARSWSGSLIELSNILHREFNRCMEIKKKESKPTVSRKKRTTKSSSSGSTSSEG